MYNDSKRMVYMAIRNIILRSTISVAIIACLAIMVLLSQSRAVAAPTVSWAPAVITDQIATGQSKKIIAVLTPSKNVKQAVVLRIVPELRPFVSVSPTALDGLMTGVPVTLTITLSALRDSPVGSFDGTIQVRLAEEHEHPVQRFNDHERADEQERVHARSLPITLRICQCAGIGGISLGYPSRWQVNQGIEPGAFVLKSTDDAFIEGGFLNAGAADIVVTTTPLPAEPLKDFIADNLRGQPMESQKQITVGGEVATKVVYSDLRSPTVEEQNIAVFVPHHGSLYRFYLSYNVGDSLESQFLADFQTILNSIRFTN